MDTARSLGIKVIVLEHAGKRGQHIDLCGKPLKRAILQCEKDQIEKEQPKLC